MNRQKTNRCIINRWLWVCLALLLPQLILSQIPPQTMKALTPTERQVIINKGTEAPFKGEYTDNHRVGTYLCRQCAALLYRSEDKFDSGCGWPSFDDEVKGAVKRVPDADGRRTEIVCAKCGGHLGHVFKGEGFTSKDTRHCVNSISMVFVPAGEAAPTAAGKGMGKAAGMGMVSEPVAFTRNFKQISTLDASKATKPGEAKRADTPTEAIFAGGCFWGVEHLMQQQAGVLSVESGYTGGTTPNPTYEQVSSHKSGHAEAVRITYDPTKVSYETLTKLFLEIHDPTQVDRQGPDVGNQYRSEIFYHSPEQQEIARRLLDTLRAKGYQVATRLTPATTFWKAEAYHQDYYQHKGTQPYCHAYTKRF